MPIPRKDLSYGKESLEELLLLSNHGDLVIQSPNDYPRVDWDRADFEQLAKELGADRVSLAAATSAEKVHYIGTLISGCPPVAFISYRRSDSEIIDWVGWLRAHLEMIGYDVLLDYVDANATPGVIGVEIPRFVALLARADVFLPIITKSYAEGADRPWIFAERETAYLRAIQGRIRFVSVLKEDTALPDAWSYFFPIADVRQDPNDFTPITNLLPPLVPRLSDEEKGKAKRVVKASEQLLRSGKFAELEFFLKSNKEFEFLHEWKEFMHYALVGQDREEAAEEVLPRLELRSERIEDIQFKLAGFVRGTGATHQALQLLWQFYRGGPTTVGCYARAHHMAADILEDLGSYEAAKNHFQVVIMVVMSIEYDQPDDIDLLLSSLCGITAIALKEGDYETANRHFGTLLELLKDDVRAIPVQLARDNLAKGDIRGSQYVLNVSARSRYGKNREPIRRLPSVRNKEIHCSFCRASYSIDPTVDRICTVCGTKYPFSIPDPGFGHCPHCLYTGTSPLQLLSLDGGVSCPVCHSGVLYVEGKGGAF